MLGSKPAFDRIRVYEMVRTAHLERARAFVPASILYSRRRYDFDSSLASDLDLIECGTVSMAIILARSRPAAVEINEPLMRSGLVRTATAVAVARASGLTRRKRVLVATYAISNMNEFDFEPTSSKARLRRAAEWLLAKYVCGQLDRIVYGTQAAANVYQSVLGHRLSGASSELIPAVPAPCSCAPSGDAEANRVLFVGALHARKGVKELLQAWPTVIAAVPTARLTIIGKGDHEPLVQQFIEHNPSAEFLLDPPRADIHRALRSAALVVLPSQPTSSWREQVGLPIIEGLAHGCHIVTSSETGLADWLAERGHTVMTGIPDADLIGRSIIMALEQPLLATGVLAQLPVHDGRQAADEWLFADGEQTRVNG